LIAPEWSESVSANETVNLWRCTICGSEFQTTDNIISPTLSESELAEEFLPELLVA
jgi:hypothetical protein